MRLMSLVVLTWMYSCVALAEVDNNGLALNTCQRTALEIVKATQCMECGPNEPSYTLLAVEPLSRAYDTSYVHELDKSERPADRYVYLVVVRETFDGDQPANEVESHYAIVHKADGICEEYVNHRF